MGKKKLYLKVKDHAVSGEEFRLLYNSDLEMLETFPRPTSKKLPDYYKSEDYISHTDSKRNLVEKAYHIVRWVSLRRKIRLVNSFSSNGRNLLDIGCGTGDFLRFAQQNDWVVMGIEPNENARRIANLKTVNSVFGTDKLLKLKPKSFDVITLWHVLEHLSELEEQLSLFKKLLKPNGTLVVAIPNFKSYDAQYYNKYWAAYDVPRHIWHFSRYSISKLFKKENMKVAKTLPMIFDAFYISLLSEKYKSNFMNPAKAFWIGLRSNLRAWRNGEYSSLIYVIKHG